MSLTSLILTGEYTKARLLLNRNVDPPPNVIALLPPEEVDLIAYLVREDYGVDTEVWSYYPHCYLSYLLLAMYKLDRVLTASPGAQYSSLMSLGKECVSKGDENMVMLLLCLGWNPLLDREGDSHSLNQRLTALLTVSAKPILQLELYNSLLTMDLPDLLFLYLQRDALISSNPRTWKRYYQDFTAIITQPAFWRQRLASEYPHVLIRDIPHHNYPFYLYCLQRLLPKIQVKDASGKVWTLALYYFEGRGFAYAWAILGKRLKLIAGDLSQYTGGQDDRIAEDSIVSKEFSLVMKDLQGCHITVQFDEEDFYRGCLLYCQLSGLKHSEHLSECKHYHY